MMNFRRMDMRRKGANALAVTDAVPEREDPHPDPGEARDPPVATLPQLVFAVVAIVTIDISVNPKCGIIHPREKNMFS